MTSSINEYVSLLLKIKVGLNSELISLLPKEYKYHDSSMSAIKVSVIESPTFNCFLSTT
jgi:hypothetical protein